MEKTTRRNLLKAAAAGGVAATGLGAVLGSEHAVAARTTDRNTRQDDDEQEHKHGDNKGPLSGGRAHVAVSFGQWEATAANPLDRHRVNSPNNRNVHKMLPFEARIDEGGAVSFIISGVHQILIYADGTQLTDVEEILPPGSILVDDPEDRIYRGLDPTALSYVALPPVPPSTTPTAVPVRDRVETVNFPEPGRYLVVCGVVFHFREGMHGFVNVRKRNDD